MEKEAIAKVFLRPESPFMTSPIAFPTLAEGELLVKIDFSTICTSDLHTFYGRRHSCSHSILGHEIIGTIAEMAAGGIKDYYGKNLAIGDRITWTIYAHDPNSNNAKKGYPQKSKGLYKYGHEQMNDAYQLNGGFASHCHLRKNTTLFKLPETLSNAEAAPLNCTHATISGALRLAGDLKNKTILINGVGMLGLSACAMAKEGGARKIWSQDIDPNKASYSQKFGAEKAFVFGEPELNTTIDREGGIDIVIETSGIPEAIENCLKLLSVGGTLILVGSVFPQRDLSINAEYMVRNLLSLKGLHNYRPEDLANAINFLEKVHLKYPFKELVGSSFDLENLDEAFATANTGKYYRIGIKP
ncbi:zinc-binding dehydrogenase [Cyclobacterium qasimii]|uniref:alcohol dehydrogenase n=2 Tax=Cyclobacterium qasimii TaxID=1350429 RepID=S7WRH9_9BACT|nr:zinc-binding dehydrogenase [Cyclobacterium qasimii]EPR69344.1 Threonine dehydrogenase [Cyclobacterium qasimii M12-11B]GEO22833.1 alcohol dehydrogenase [Cyclobacterium qasimii]